jgi:hypothetical protein
MPSRFPTTGKYRSPYVLFDPAPVYTMHPKAFVPS